ncbi:MAG: hypothetical protein H6Q14_1618 [Bacteroidetes bacterium]|nr:hypothetical protein [Bacteroidota bacterium]
MREDRMGCASSRNQRFSIFSCGCNHNKSIHPVNIRHKDNSFFGYDLVLIKKIHSDECYYLDLFKIRKIDHEI